MSIIGYDNRHDQPAWRSDAEVMGIYNSWLAKHGKAYNDLGEHERRFEIFKDNLRFIDDHNALNRTYKTGLNRFADLSNEEYRAIYLGTRTDPKRRVMKSKNPSRRYAFRAGEKLPLTVDWRTTGAVNPIKDQGSCGKQIFSFLDHGKLHLNLRCLIISVITLVKLLGLVGGLVDCLCFISIYFIKIKINYRNKIRNQTYFKLDWEKREKLII
jgi:hypothetical protein